MSSDDIIHSRDIIDPSYHVKGRGKSIAKRRID
jgi:hypothetical protein